MKDSKEIVNSYLKKSDWRVKENSNRPFSYGAMSQYGWGEIAKDYWLREVYPEDIAQAYISNYIHIHDLNCLSLYCCGYSLKDILRKGVRGVSNIPTSAPAKHFDSALNQIANLITVFQNEIAGAVALNSFDTLLAPYIKNDNLNYEQVKQGIQNYIFSVNSNSRGGAEPAFSNITFDLEPPADLVYQPARIAGKKMDYTYGECQNEMDMLNKAFCEVMLEGDADGKLFAYPIPTYNIHGKFDWDNPRNNLIFAMAGKYGVPYFANFINSEMDVSEARSMCPLSGDTKILYYSKYRKRWYTSAISDVYNGMQKCNTPEITMIANGKKVRCKLNKFDIPATYEITLSNNQVIKTTANHLNKVYGKDYIRTSDLTTNDYLPIYKRPIVLSDSMTYEEGKLVGMFLGDGSYKDKNSICFSLGKDKKSALIDFLYEYCPDKFNATVSTSALTSSISGKQSCMQVTVISKYCRALIEQFVIGDSALTKSLHPNVIATSEAFRRGIIDGLYATDGGNRNRIYTSSSDLVQSLSLLCASLGTTVNVTSDEREGRLGSNPCYTVRWYACTNESYKNSFIVSDDYIWIKIKNISVNSRAASVSYCAEVLDEDAPEEFMLANGIVTHNCRLRLDLRELRKKNGGLFGAGDSTGSVGVVTINLPRIAYETKGNIEAFYKLLDEYLIIAKNSLEIKRKWIQENILDTGAIPAYKEYVGTLDNHFSVIGEVGANEMCENFMGKNILDPEAHKFVHDVHEFILGRLRDFQEETGNLYAFEATPAEGTCYRFALNDKRIHPDIITQGSGEDVYYTNSCHIPVSLIDGIDSTLKHQEDLQVQFNSGTVIHLYMEGGISSEQAKSIVRSAFENYRIPYLSLSPISRYCDEHKYIQDKVDECPHCGARLKKYQRITGYLRCIDNFNRGKAAEFKDRKQINI